MSTLRASQLVKSYRGRRVVDGVSLEFHQGEIVGLLGPNGAGKTTTFYMMVGLIAPDSGTVTLDETDVTPLPVYRRSRLGIGYLPQESSVFRSLSVMDNLRLGPSEQGLPKKEVEERVERLLAEFKLEALAHTPGYALSGGECRRVEIARALALNPSFLLLDEPFSGIDPIAVYDIQQMVLGLRDKGFGVLITDHNVRDTLAITDHAHLIHRGAIVVSGSPQQVADSEVAKKYYLGERFSW